MQTIRKRLSILLVACSIAAILLITLFVNITVNDRFNSYMIDIQNKRYERIVDYFQEVYKRDGRWGDDSGIELMHEAYMSNYYLTLMDKDENPVWGMDPSDIIYDPAAMPADNRGVYTTQKFDIMADGNVVGYINIGQYSSVLLSEEDINFKSAINRSIFTSGALALLIIVFISLYFSKQFSTPIKQLARMSTELSSGNFKMKTARKSDIEELENLRNSMNILSEKLNYQDILRKRLVTDISHEIRTPLNVLQNNLEAMIDGVFPVTPQRLNYLNEEVIRFGRLLSNLDTLKSFESENIELDFETLTLDELLSDIYKDFSRAFDNKNIAFDLNVQPGENYLIRGDKNKLKQVFINILSNSLKFTESHGSVSIDLTGTNRNIIVKIKDNGIGIKKEDMPFIFERLYRGDKSRHKVEGNGIGLTIAKNILDLHEAVIEIESEEGKGTVFTVLFNR